MESIYGDDFRNVCHGPKTYDQFGMLQQTYKCSFLGKTDIAGHFMVQEKHVSLIARLDFSPVTVVFCFTAFHVTITPSAFSWLIQLFIQKGILQCKHY